METNLINYEFEAYNSSGARVSGEIAANNPQEALDLLHNRGLLPHSLSPANRKKRPRRRLKKLRAQDLIVMTRQLATMQKAGLPLTQSLAALRRQSKHPGRTELLERIINDIEAGLSLSDALRLNPGVFSKLYISMVAAGEAGGILAEVLDRVANYLESSARLRRKVRSAMAYPIVVCIFAMLISVFLVTKIIPVFAEIFADSGQSLPLPTVLLLQLSDLVRGNFVSFLAIVLTVMLMLVMCKRTAFGTIIWDHSKLRFPVVGALVEKIVLTRFAQTCAALLRSGVPLLNTLGTVSHAVGNRIIESAVQKAALSIESGSDFATAMSQQGVFPDMMVEMVAAGEKTGNVVEMLQQISEYYEEQVDTALNGLTALIDPLLIAVLGTIVGTIVICMFLPLFKLSQVVQF